MVNNLKISLVIPAYNEEKYIGPCLEHVLLNSRGRFSEIIVVDSGSTDRTCEVANRYPGVHVVRDQKKGPNHARQLGLEASSGDLVAFLDADTWLSPNWIPAAEKFFAAHPGAVSISGPYRYYDGTPYLRFLLWVSWWVSAPVIYTLVGYMVLGGNFIAKRSALTAMGGFDTSIHFYGDDTDTARRLRAHGKVVFQMNFTNFSSCRRFKAQGFLRTTVLYVLNFMWQVVFHHPFSKPKNNPAIL